MICRRPTVFTAVMALVILTWPLGAGAAQLSLTWSDAFTTELGFSVERSTGTTGSYSEVARRDESAFPDGDGDGAGGAGVEDI